MSKQLQKQYQQHTLYLYYSTLVASITGSIPYSISSNTKYPFGTCTLSSYGSNPCSGFSHPQAMGLIQVVPSTRLLWRIDPYISMQS